MRTWRSDDDKITLYHADCREILPTLDSIDTCIADCPYGIGFMGKHWDDEIPGVPIWKLVMGALKPGAFLFASGSTRKWHRLVCAIEDSGFEIRDMIIWLFGSGFPKSMNISKEFDKKAGAVREVIGQDPNYHSEGKRTGKHAFKVRDGGRGQVYTSEPGLLTAPATEEAKRWDGWGTALKPAWEPFSVAMKPLDGTFIENATRHGVSGLNIDGARIESHDRTTGRWPPNVAIDGAVAVMIDRYNKGASRFFYCPKISGTEKNAGGDIRNDHPTVRPLAFLKWLCRMSATPKSGTILDPFMGSGSTGVAAFLEGRSFIGIERDRNSFETAIERLVNAGARPADNCEIQISDRQMVTPEGQYKLF